MKNVKISESARNIIDGCKFKKEISDTKKFFTDKLNKHEDLSIIEWYNPFIYFEIIDTRIKHYPCHCRALISFDTSNGKIASHESENRYQFTRYGWTARICDLIGYKPNIYSSCDNPENEERC